MTLFRSPAAGPRGVAARWPWNSTDRSSPGMPRKNLFAGRSKILPSREYSRKARRNNSGNGIGTSSAIGGLRRGGVNQRERRVPLRRFHQVANRHPLHHRVRHFFFSRTEADGRNAHQSHRGHAVGAESPLVDDRFFVPEAAEGGRSEEHTSELQSLR